MVIVVTWGGYPEGGMSGKVFPTLDHPPRYVLMGGEHMFDGGISNYPQLWYPEAQDPLTGDG